LVDNIEVIARANTVQLKLVINTLKELVEKFMVVAYKFKVLVDKPKVLARTIKRKVVSAIFRLKLWESIEFTMVQDSNSTPLPKLLYLIKMYFN